MMRAFLSLAASALLIFSLGPTEAFGQFNEGRSSGNSSKQRQKKTSVFNANRAGNFNDYRVSLNEEYARQIKEYEWKQQQMKKGESAPDRDVKPVSPVEWDKNRDREDQEIVIDEVIKPVKNDERAKPIAPVVVPEGEGGGAPTLEVSYFGTPVKLHVPASKFTVGGTSQSVVADAWTKLSKPEYAEFVSDCLRYKQKNGLCDWAFMVFLESVAKAAASGPNAVSVMMTYLASQAGYNVRLAIADEGVLDMMYASQHLILDRPYIVADSDRYYPYFTRSNSYYICQSRFDTETGVSLQIARLPKVDSSVSPTRTVKSKRYPDFIVNSSVNKNLISFYNTYPTSILGTNPVTRWAMYANTPMSDHVRQTLYPQLKSHISGMSQLDAVQRILNWIQTGFVYEYDDKVWGGDRAFFAEESLFYPYCDCEDRSILFTRLVRDLLGLKCLLVFYPGHLAAAVNFPTDVSGDYIMYNGKKFTITDPTYIGAPVGDTMPDMDNASAKIILLD